MATEVGYFENLTEMPPDGPFVVCRVRLYRVEVAPSGDVGCPTWASDYVRGLLADNGFGGDCHRIREHAHRAADWLNDRVRSGEIDSTKIREV